MKLKNILLVVDDLKKSVAFYEELFGLRVITDNDGNIIMTEGLCLQDRRIWEFFTDQSVNYRGHDAELYFVEDDIEGFQKKLEQCSFEIEYVNRLMTHSWGQRVIRIYDPDHHVIEIGESMEAVQKRIEPDKEERN